MFYNSLSRNRTSIVRLHVNVAIVQVEDPTGKVIPSQVDPFFVDNTVSSSTFKVCRSLYLLTYYSM